MGCLPAWNSNQSFVPETTAAAAVSFPVCIDQAQESGSFVPTVLGNPTTIEVGGQSVVSSAEAIRVTYRLSYERSDEDAEEKALAFELAFTDQMGEYIDSVSMPAGFRATRLSDRSLDDALEASVGGDFLFIAITFILMTILVAAISFSRNPVKNKAILSIAAVSATGLAIPAAFGLCSYIGLPFVAIVGVSPFLLLALGIDNALVLMATFLRTSSKLPAAKRTELMLRDAG